MLLILSSWLALSVPPGDFGPSGKTATPIPSAYLEKRLSLCNKDSTQKRGCLSALRYLEELLSSSPMHPSKERERIETRYSQIKAKLQNAKVSEKEWVTGALNAWLAEIDPHAKLLSREDSDRRASAEKILVQGAGAKLRFHKGRVLVGYSMEGSAAESIGLKPGDQILALNGKAFSALNESAKRRWLSETSSPYRLEIARDGVRKTLLIHEKRYYLANIETHTTVAADGVKEGVLRVRSFDKDNTCRELRSAIHEIEQEHVQRLRLNLKNNPGGLVREAQCVAGLFLGKGKLFAKLKKVDNREARELIPAVPTASGVGNEEQSLLFTEIRQATSLPLLVEINQNSASAAEMLAAALQDHRRARVVGVRSFGKGSMQSVFHPWSNENLYLTRTTHHIYRPSGAGLQFSGVMPDQALQQLEGDNFPRERELTL